MNSNSISHSTAFNNTNNTAVKRKLEDDDYLVMSHKRLYKLNTQQDQQQYKENTTLPIMAQNTTIYSSSMFIDSNIKQDKQQDDDIQQVDMMDYDLTDEDESLQTPSSMNDFTVIQEEEEDGNAFIGDLERGWVEMFSESYYPDY
ncbi:hypothetical protein K501DRAFT_282153 [Backusella circina FSU 941]|nr:hypothetical protein K501DRAFT_282153 [Backusella circina FSU 941]